MSRPSLVPLFLFGALALGCTTATAQESERPPEDAERRLRMEGESRKAVAYDLERLQKAIEDAEGRERAELHLELSRLYSRNKAHDDALREVQRALAVDPVFAAAHEMLDDLKNAHRTRDERARLRRLEGEIAGERAPRGERWLPGGRGGARLPAPRAGRGGVEDRVARLERAVQDMRRLLERHGVDPADRDRALAEMRERETAARRRGTGGSVSRFGRTPQLASAPRFPDPERGRRLAAEGWMKRIEAARALLEAAAEGEKAQERLEEAAKTLTHVATELARDAHSIARTRAGRSGRGGRGGTALAPGSGVRGGSGSGRSRRADPRVRELQEQLDRHKVDMETLRRQNEALRERLEKQTKEK